MEKFIRLTANVPDLRSAWVFVMAHVDEIPRPRIEIVPILAGYDLAGVEAYGESFDVVVAGDVNNESIEGESK